MNEKSSTEKKPAEAALIVAATILLLIVSPIANGWALSILWKWFIVPLFGLGSLSIAQAIGLGLVVSFVAMPSPTKLQESYTEWLGRMYGIAITKPLYSLLFGYIVKGFLP